MRIFGNPNILGWCDKRGSDWKRIWEFCFNFVFLKFSFVASLGRKVSDEEFNRISWNIQQTSTTLPKIFSKLIKIFCIENEVQITTNDVDVWTCQTLRTQFSTYGWSLAQRTTNSTSFKFRNSIASPFLRKCFCRCISYTSHA